jgi:hypothetical protein
LAAIAFKNRLDDFYKRMEKMSIAAWQKIENIMQQADQTFQE